MKLSRRALLAAALPLAGVAIAPWVRRQAMRLAGGRKITGSIVGPDVAAGHLLRGAQLPSPSEELSVPVAILGGGISGLSAAWKLAGAGFDGFRLFELESEVGGTSRWGRSPVTGFPWGAHYVPVPGPDARAVRQLLGELGVIRGYSASGQPDIDERYLCFAPQERLFMQGKWHEGLYPSVGASESDRAQLTAFRSEMDSFRGRQDAGGRPAFTIPIDRSSRDPDLLALDRLSMRAWLASRGYDSPRLLWYVEYACRDDYGSTLENTSAWAAIFYYASRQASDATADEGQVLTWPEGNGWIVNRLRERLATHLVPRSLVCRVELEPGGVRSDVLDLTTRKMTRVHSKAAILALPKFASRHVAPSLPQAALAAFTYAPWVVANVTVDAVPAGRGSPPCWDNVFYASESLGYIVATHQQLTAHPGPSVLTWYQPLVREEPAVARARMMTAPWKRWVEEVLKDLSIGHPGIEDQVSSVDVMLWGHGMVRPTPGFVWGEARRQLVELPGPLFLAHSDLSGLPLFEEAQYRGVLAAERSLAQLGVKYETSL